MRKRIFWFFMGIIFGAIGLFRVIDRFFGWMINNDVISEPDMDTLRERLRDPIYVFLLRVLRLPEDYLRKKDNA